MILAGLSFLIIHLILPPFIFVIIATLTLASFGKSLGIRKIYVKILLFIFEYARKTSSTTREVSGNQFVIGDSEDESSEDEEPSSKENEVVRKRPKLGQIGRKVTRHNLISRRDTLNLVPSKPSLARIESAEKMEEQDEEDGEKKRPLVSQMSLETLQREFELGDVLDYVKTGIASIIEDEVTSRFVAEELKSWNLMTRANSQFEFINWRLTAFWLLGGMFRYFFLLPARLLILVIGMLLMMFSCIGLSWVPGKRLRNWLYERVALTVFRCFSRSFSACINFHDRENMPKTDGICVANHTSPIDVVILSVDRPYALVGQSHPGFMGIFQKSLSRGAAHIWFQRAQAKDRLEVARRLRDHVEDPDKMPILIFPEGTCINNTSVMQFKKGSFEVGGKIYPVAIKYDSKFGDAFWNSSRYSIVTYLLMMMTSWAIVVDVWYLPPMEMEKDETSIEFAERVKHEIAKKGGLVELLWDGNLKRNKVKSEWKVAAQQQFVRRIKGEREM